MWELDGWDGLAANFAHETAGGRDQDPSLAEWWAAAASLRRGGVDRIVVPTSWTRSVEELIADGVRGEVYAHELVTRAARARAASCSTRCEREGSPAVRALGLEPVGAYAVAMADDSEALLLWAIPDWATWVAYEQAWAPDGALAPLAQDAARPRRLAGGGSCSSTRRSTRCAPAASRRRPTAARSRSSDGGERPPAVITDDGIDRLRARINVPEPWPQPPHHRVITTDTFRHVAEAYGDDNPLWCDPAYGATTRWGGPIAPPPLVGGDTLVGDDEVTEVAGRHSRRS